jgi:hypothetical protein
MAARDTLGERMAALEAKFDGFDKYTHDKWHEQAQKLQPLYMLPERLTRDVAKLQGTVDGRINSVTKEIERSIVAAIEKAIEPMSRDITELNTRVTALELSDRQETGARRLAVWIAQTVIAAVSAIVAVLALGRHP